MGRNSLTALGLKRALDAAQAEAVANGLTRRINDGDGLMLVVRPNGAASWVLRHSVGGRRTDLTMGRWPTVSLALAREEADKARRSVAAGNDPGRERETARIARRTSDDSVRKLFEDWLERNDQVSAVYRANIEAAFKKDVLPVMGSMLPGNVQRSDITRVLRAIEARDATVMLRRVRMWLRQLFEFAIDDERRPGVRASPVPTGNLNSYKRKKSRHYPAITLVHEVPALMRAIRQQPQFINRTALMLSAYVWQRPTEIREAVWAEFDLRGAVWKIPAARMKMDHDHWVPLAPQVVKLLRMHQGVVGTEGWLFPGRRIGKPISEGTLLTCLIAMGFEHRHTPHGFRAMARTILDEHLRCDTRWIEKQLSHEVDESKLGGAYNRAEYWDDRVKMMRLWADWLDAQ